jgi:hypothetical protein
VAAVAETAPLPKHEGLVENEIRNREEGQGRALAIRIPRAIRTADENKNHVLRQKSQRNQPRLAVSLRIAGPTTAQLFRKTEIRIRIVLSELQQQAVMLSIGRLQHRTLAEVSGHIFRRHCADDSLRSTLGRKRASAPVGARTSDTGDPSHAPKKKLEESEMTTESVCCRRLSE